MCCCLAHGQRTLHFVVCPCHRRPRKSQRKIDACLVVPRYPRYLLRYVTSDTHVVYRVQDQSSICTSTQNCSSRPSSVVPTIHLQYYRVKVPAFPTFSLCCTHN